MSEKNGNGLTWDEWLRDATYSLAPGMGKPGKETLEAMRKDWRNNVNPGLWNEAYNRVAAEI